MGLIPGRIVELEDEGSRLLCAVVVDVAPNSKGPVRVLTEKGREQKLNPNKVLHDTGVTLATRDRERWAELAGEYGQRSDELSQQVELHALWELALAEGESPSLSALADLSLGASGGAERSAVLRAVVSDGLLFKRRGLELSVRTREAVEEIRHQREAEARREAARQAFVDWMRARYAQREPLPLEDPAANTPEDAPARIEGLLRLASGADSDTETERLARTLDPDNGHDPVTGAQRALLAAAVMAEDENLAVIRHGLRAEFPAAAREAAEAASERLEQVLAEPGRTDLSEQPCVTIDSADTVEVDDALYAERRPDGTTRVFVHIADVTRFVLPDDPLDREAQRRGVTVYLPDRRLPMLPDSLGTGVVSLSEGDLRPALSFIFDVYDDGRAAGFEVKASTVRVHRRLDYDEVEAALAGNPAERLDAGTVETLRLLSGVAARMQRYRFEHGAVIIRTEEVEPQVGADGTVSLKRIDNGSPARVLVSELMVQTGGLAGGMLAEIGVDALFRGQPASENRPEAPPPEALPSPELAFALRMSMRPVEMGIKPKAHAALGLGAYCQVTSPIRRYHDVVLHRILRAVSKRLPEPYDAGRLRGLGAQTDAAARVARSIENETDQYWFLKHLSGRQGEEIDATVLRSDGARTTVELSDYCMYWTFDSQRRYELGEKIRVRVKSANPRRGRLRLVEL